MRHPSTSQAVWLAADYHFPSTYSCRVPMSSMSSVRALPAPGPATVRLALVRTGIELFGMEYTRDVLFPIIRAAGIYIRPPERVAFSVQRIRAYKASTGNRLDDSIIYREVAHAVGLMTVYINVPTEQYASFIELLMAIGYWGQASSLVCCVDITGAVPETDVCAQPVRLVDGMLPIQKFVSSLVTEFRDTYVRWEEILPELYNRQTDAIRPQLYLWPMVIIEQRGSNKVLLRRSIADPEDLVSNKGIYKN